MKIQNILILAGGDGTRFWPLQHKSLFSFLGKPILGHLIDNITRYAEKIVVVVNEENKEYVGRNYPKAQIVLQEKGMMGMGTAVASCKGAIKGGALVLNTEDVLNFSVFEEYLKILQKGPKDYIFLLRKINEYFPGAYVKYAGNQIEEFVEKPDPNTVPSDMTKLVADYFGNFDVFLEALDKTKTDKDDWYEQGINAYLKEHTDGATVLYSDYWFVMKYSWQVLSMMSYFLHTIKKEAIGKGARISKNALVVGPVWIGDNVKVGDFTKIVGPTYIGDNVVIGDHTLVRESHIGIDALVGGGSEVARSYIGKKVMLHRNYVGDSVLDQEVLMGSGVVTANFRFDAKTIKSNIGDKKIDSNLTKFGAVIGEGSKIGVNSTIFPGIKIGQHTFIAPSEGVEADLQDDVFLSKGIINKNLLK